MGEESSEARELDERKTKRLSINAEVRKPCLKHTMSDLCVCVKFYNSSQIPEFKPSVVYKASSRTPRATQRNLVSKNKQKQTNKSYIIAAA